MRAAAGRAGLRGTGAFVSGRIQLRGVIRRLEVEVDTAPGAPRTRLRDAGSGEAHLDGASAGENCDVGRGE